jgi:hypothetical protein
MSSQSIRDILDSLPAQKRAQLMLAFDHQIPQHIDLGDHTFIGVNVDTIKGLEITERAGVWAIGVITDGVKS